MEYECCSCSKQYNEEIDPCEICGEKIVEKNPEESNYFNEMEPERTQDR